MSSALLMHAEKVGKAFGREKNANVEVLKDLDFEISPGDRVAILGKSGVGKSTLLHILGTLERPSTGKIAFLGRELSSFSETELAAFRNRHIGFVFQFHYLMLEFTAYENILVPGVIAGSDLKVNQARAEQLLKRVGLSDRRDHKPGQLSGGEQQRVAIARAIMMKPKLLLTDEMTGNLDPSTGRQVFDLIQELHEEEGTALISVTHDESLAKEYPTIYRLESGRLVRLK